MWLNHFVTLEDVFVLSIDLEYDQYLPITYRHILPELYMCSRQKLGKRKNIGLQ